MAYPSLFYLVSLLLVLPLTSADTINILGIPATVYACGSAKITLFYSPVPTADVSLNLYIANSGLGQSITITGTSSSSPTSSVAGSGTSPTSLIATTVASTTSRQVVTIPPANSATSNTARVTSTATTVASSSSSSLPVASTTAAGVTSTRVGTSTAVITAGSTTTAVAKRLFPDSDKHERPKPRSPPPIPDDLDPLNHPSFDRRAAASINTTITTSLVIPAGTGNVTYQWGSINVPVGNYKLYGFAVSPSGEWSQKVTTPVTVIQGSNSSCLSNLGSGSGSVTTTGGKSNTGAIVGGVVAGIAMLGALIGGVWWYRRRKQRAKRFQAFESWVPPTPADGTGRSGPSATNGPGGFGLGISGGSSETPPGEKSGWLSKGGKIGAVLGGGAGVAAGGAATQRNRSGSHGGAHRHKHSGSTEAMGMRSLTSTSLGDTDDDLEKDQRMAVEPYSPDASVENAPVLLAGYGMRDGHGGGMEMLETPGFSSPAGNQGGFGGVSTASLFGTDPEMRELAALAAAGSKTPAGGSVTDLGGPFGGQGQRRSSQSPAALPPPLPSVVPDLGKQRRRPPPSPPIRTDPTGTDFVRKPSVTGTIDGSPSLERSGSTVKRKPVPTIGSAEPNEPAGSPSFANAPTGRESWQRGSVGDHQELIRDPSATPGQISSPFMLGTPIQGASSNPDGNGRSMSGGGLKHVLTVDEPLALD